MLPIDRNLSMKTRKKSLWTLAVRRSKDRQFYASILGGNGKKVFTSETYRSRQAAAQALTKMVKAIILNSYRIDLHVPRLPRGKAK